MKTNCNVTLYNKYTDKTTKAESWKVTVIKGFNDKFGAMWQGHEEAGVSTAETGKGVLNVTDEIKVYIPMDSDFNGKAYIEPKAWFKLADSERDKFFTFQQTDRIVKGECDFIPDSTHLITNLNNYDNVVSIMSIKINDFGSKKLQHYALGGK